MQVIRHFPPWNWGRGHYLATKNQPHRPGIKLPFWTDSPKSRNNTGPKEAKTEARWVERQYERSHNSKRQGQLISRVDTGRCLPINMAPYWTMLILDIKNTSLLSNHSYKLCLSSPIKPKTTNQTCLTNDSSTRQRADNHIRLLENYLQ